VSGPRGFLRRRSLRARITIAFVASAATLVLVVGLGTYLTVRQILQEQELEAATRQTVFGLLFAREFVGDDETRSQRAVSLLKTREDLEALVTVDGSWFASSLGLTPDAIPAGLRGFVADEKLAYEYAEVGQDRAVVFGAPLPPAGVDLYLFYPLSDVDRTLSLLARVLLVIGVIGVAFAALFALRLSRRILQPLAAVSGAAQQVAEGLLETRVPTSSADELGALADSFNRMAAALQERIRRERRFVASVSHELRTPLATLEATSGLLSAHRGELSPEAREAVDLVSEDVTDLRRLVEELLETSELDGGTAQVRWERVDLRALVEAVVHRRRREIPVVGESVVTFGDKARLERIVGNLVDNAFEHGEGDSVRARIDVDGEWCQIEITDHGPGIPTADLPRIFDRFYKADVSRTRDRGGVGLGLSIAQQNARLMGGIVRVRSALDQGATFTLQMPMRDVAPEEEPAPEGAA
jgi:two-component system sensor histidine kinase MtrB